MIERQNGATCPIGAFSKLLGALLKLLQLPGTLTPMLRTGHQDRLPALAGIGPRKLGQSQGIIEAFMKRFFINTALRLSIIASGLAVTAAASAQSQNAWFNAKNTSMYLSVAGGIQCPPSHGPCWLNDGQNIIVWSPVGLTPDEFWWTPYTYTSGTLNDGYYDPKGNRLCIGVAGGSTTPGTGLIVWPCQGQTDQNWEKVPATVAPYNLNASGCFVFVNNKDQQVMAVAGGNVTQGARVIQWPVDSKHPATLDMAWCAR